MDERCVAAHRERMPVARERGGHLRGCEAAIKRRSAPALIHLTL
jgi:hypothetical protein